MTTANIRSLGGLKWGMYLVNTKHLIFWLCNMKQLNFIGIFILTIKDSLKQHFFFQKEAKTAPIRPILFCLVYQAEFLAMLRQFRIIAENFRRLPRILKD